LSSVSADAASDTVTLTFTGAVKSGAAAEYAVTVAGAAIEVTAVQQKTAQTVVLQLEGDLQAGATVVVDYSISDNKGLPLSGQAKATAK
ncbi:MAG TPA: SwmB domain-containing protein, partial [Abditibacteriaceae bacterium]